MKRILCILTLCVILFVGCSQGESTVLNQGEQPQPQQSEQVQPQQSEPTQPDQSEMTDQERLEAAEAWLKRDCSFTMNYQYMNLAINGMQQSIEQTFGKDGSWSMTIDRKLWDHSTDYRKESTARYYYRYEDSQLVCYLKENDEEPRRSVVSDRVREEIEVSKALMIGAPGLMPDYLEGLYVAQAEGRKDDITVLAYWLPVKDVLTDGTMLSAYLRDAFKLSGNTYPPEANAGVLTILEVDSQTCQPISLTYIFHEVKPYVLSTGAQSGEAAFDADFMTMYYTFDYNIPDAVEFPEEMIP